MFFILFLLLCEIVFAVYHITSVVELPRRDSDHHRSDYINKKEKYFLLLFCFRDLVSDIFREFINYE
jgi:hypothetical protein